MLAPYPPLWHVDGSMQCCAGLAAVAETSSLHQFRLFSSGFSSKANMMWCWRWRRTVTSREGHQQQRAVSLRDGARALGPGSPFSSDAAASAATWLHARWLGRIDWGRAISCVCLERVRKEHSSQTDRCSCSVLKQRLLECIRAAGRQLRARLQLLSWEPVEMLAVVEQQIP